MTALQLREFNRVGMIKFNERLNRIRISRQWEPLDELLEDDGLTRVVTVEEVEFPSSFSSRYECGRFFSELFESCEADLERIGIDPQTSVGLWGWISAVLGDFLKGAGKEPFIGEASRWIFMPHDFNRYYRHLLAGPYMIFEMHKDDPSLAAILLYNEVTKPNTAYVEQIASRPLLVDNKAAMRLIHDMYFDYSRNKPKRIGETGATVVAGDIRRFGVVFNQLALTWDVAGLTASELAAILPKEFRPLLPT